MPKSVTFPRLRQHAKNLVGEAWVTNCASDGTHSTALEHLSFTDFSTSAKISRDYLRAITPGTTLKTVKLEFPSKTFAPLSFAQLEDIFDTLSLHTGLQEIEIVGKLDEEAQAHIRADRKSVTSNLLSKLYDIPNITHLFITLEHNPVIADLSTIHALMDAWPKLQHFVILPRSATPVRRLDDIDFSAVHWETISFLEWIALLKRSPIIRNLPTVLSRKDIPTSVANLQGFSHSYDGFLRINGLESTIFPPEVAAVIKVLLPNMSALSTPHRVGEKAGVFQRLRYMLLR
jgi:hypothetical protein